MKFRFTSIALVLVVLLGAWSATLPAQQVSTVRFENQSGEACRVKLVGPSPQYVDVPNLASRTVSVQGGWYHIVTRYGEPGKYRYQKGDSFEVIGPPIGISQTTITLHKVIGGNYATRSTDERDFQ